MSRRKRFGEILLERGILNEVSLQQALARQKETGKPLGHVLEEMGIISEQEIATILAGQFGYKTVTGIARHNFPESVLQVVAGERALKSLIFPLKIDQRTLFLAMANPLDIKTIDDLAFRSGLRIIPCVTTPTEIQQAVQRHYFREVPAEEAKKPDWWTILVVDDQDMVRTAIAAALKKVGYNVIEARNGAEGLQTALQQRVHLIITDTVMPRMDGEEMFRALLANEGTRGLPVIALSAKAAPEEEARLLDMGYFDFIAKPINPVRLVARARRALRAAHGDEPPA